MNILGLKNTITELKIQQTGLTDQTQLKRGLIIQKTNQKKIYRLKQEEIKGWKIHERAQDTFTYQKMVQHTSNQSPKREDRENRAETVLKN